MNLSAWEALHGPSTEHLEALQQMGHAMRPGFDFILEMGIWSFQHPTQEFTPRP